MAPGYQGSFEEEKLPHKHDALSGSEFAPGLESENPEADRKLKEKILTNLDAHVELDTSDVQIFVKNGYVSINGTANNIEEKSTIEALVAKFDEVVDVVNFLNLRSAFESGSGNGIHGGIP
jgi:hypothetical protein